MSKRMLRLGVPAAVCALMLCVLASAESAVAAEPWWHVNTVSAPAAAAGGVSKLVVEVSDLGDAMVDATAHPVTVVDTLPAGVTATEAFGEGGGGSIGGSISVENGGVLPCSISGGGRTVTCAYSEVLLAYERLMVAVNVQVEAGAGTGVNEVSVSGGGAPAVVARRALALEGVPPNGTENYELTPEEEGGAPATQAGSHPFQLTTTFTLNTRTVMVKHAKKLGQQTPLVAPEAQPLEIVKDLRFVLPPGLVGNPTPLPKCTLSVFVHDAQECPEDTVIGVATPIVANVDDTANVPLAATVPLYSIEPQVGEPARFGFLEPTGPVLLDTSVIPGGPGGGYRVVVSVPDIPDAQPVIGSQVTFWGVPADPRHDTTRGRCLAYAGTAAQALREGERSCPTGEKPQPFLVLPTSCTGPLVTSMQSDSWEHIGAYTPLKEYATADSLGESFGLDGCDRLSFEPSISITPDGQQASTPTGLSVGVHVPQEASLNPSGLAESSVRDTTVVLPAGVALNPAGGDGLGACGLTEIGLEDGGEQSCPEAAKVGTLEINTPLLPNPLVGAAYLASPAPFGEPGQNPFGSLLAMYLVARDPVSGVLVKLAGEVKPDPVTGQLTATFRETPQLPFEDLTLHFFGGSRAPLGTPALCGSYSAQASIAPWSGSPAPDVSSAPFLITSAPNGSPCSNPLPFAPSLTAGSLNIQAGAFGPFSMTMSREDGNQNLKAIQLHMPPGLSGSLAGVALCGEAQANAGTCGPESLIGETTVSVGLGGNPYTVKGGRVYFTGPYQGAPFGLSIVNPANAGPFHLGNVVVRAKIEIDPFTAALTITSDPSGPHAIPPFIDGIPLQIKHVNVLIDRPGFTFNPTNCEPMRITGQLQSIEGGSSALAVPFQVTNCATLKFAPQFSVATSGKTSKANGASLSVKLVVPTAIGKQANIAKVKVELPKALPSRLTTLRKACLAATFDANPADCPAASIVGHASATTPILPVPLSGPAYFVSHGGEAFPSLIVVLQGYGVTVDLVGSTFISKKGITSSTFKTVPDVPVGTFELTLPEGPFSALAANVNLCKSTLTMPTEFLAQNGDTIHRSTPIAVSDCRKARHLVHRHRKHARGKRAKQGKKK